MASQSPRVTRRLFAPSVAGSATAGIAVAATATATTASSSTTTTTTTTRAYSLRRSARNAATQAQPIKADEEEIKPLVPATPPRRKTALSLKAEPDADADEKKPLGRTPSKRSASNPFEISPQKQARKKIKLDLDPSEVKAAPKRWQEQLAVLTAQRRKITAPVDEMGCEENGTDAHRADGWRTDEDAETKARRERFTCLISLMLSSQTKDEVTASAVKNLQLNLRNGLCLESILSSTDEEISTNINKVGFWRRKTGYIKSAAHIISTQFNSDVPKDIDDLCSLPGVGPKMAFLCLQSAWQINLGIGVDVHVHRMSNRLGWCKTTDPEDTRLVLQSWLPKDLHHSINKTLVGFGQVVCVPVGPRCDLCDLGKKRLCPSRRKVDPKSIASRKVVEFNRSHDGDEAKVDVVLEGPSGVGKIDDAESGSVKCEDEERQLVSGVVEQRGGPLKREGEQAQQHHNGDTPPVKKEEPDSLSW